MSLATDQELNYPEELKRLICIRCKKLLQWENDKIGALYPMDLTASAACCDRLYHAYASRIKVYSTKDGE
jgi:hypothetical protein